MEKITSRAQQYMNVGGLNSDYKKNSEVKINWKNLQFLIEKKSSSHTKVYF